MNDNHNTPDRMTPEQPDTAHKPNSERSSRHEESISYRKSAGKTMRSLLLLLLLAAVVIFAYLLTRKNANKVDMPSSEMPASQSGTASERVASESAASSTSESEASSSAQPQSESQQSSEQTPKPDDQAGYQGTIMPRANTGSFKHAQHGKGMNHNVAAGIYAYPVDKVKAASNGELDLVGKNKIAFLTYDDGVNSHSDELLDILKDEGVPATFFVVGKYLDDNPAALKRMLDEGHAIALHSWNHEYDELYPNRVAKASEVVAQATDELAKLRELLGDKFNSGVWRYPGGHMSWNEMKPADDALRKMGIEWIDWNAMNSDAEPESRRPDTIQGQVDSVIDTWGMFGNPNTMVILMHDTPNKQLTRDAATHIIKALREKGFSFGIME